ncbi:hypothetical protein DBR39_01425 [Chryseobacterium sp. KBW03]|uniref:hypothetical protein n=1 Tax=Chryseobacterium sp. KBW03 TaxID=2153362 RepID=UPI000F598355|nr:hypothetical protein [Chryseobacterium sp. KBW03]RQO42566.1 hypothetical protein DBR39_01425 [Chryseobacterium sp. KBW03]
MVNIFIVGISIGLERCLFEINKTFNRQMSNKIFTFLKNIFNLIIIIILLILVIISVTVLIIVQKDLSNDYLDLSIVYDGCNINIKEDGLYDIVLDMTIKSKPIYSIKLSDK